jgi:hypothetical protein
VESDVKQEQDNSSSSGLDELQANWQVQERPFVSHVPVVGSLIVGLREMWNSVSTKWYVRPLLHQQNRVNQLVLVLLDRLYRQSVEHGQRLTEYDERLILQDRDAVALTREVGELQIRLRQLEKRLAALEQVRR